MSADNWKFDTLVIHGAQSPDEWMSATVAPIYQTASHRFDTAEELSDVFAGKKAGFIYQRLRNPTNQVLEKRISLPASQFDGKGYGALLTFGLEDEKACFEFIRRVKLVYHLANLGDCKTLVIHPWSSQYISFSEESRRDNGITPDLVRVSVGIEAAEDILEDFDQALKGI
jgi:O-acetylhomoserine/O-acetylserine sulfhydrylase-like pyridoxal-dependent enzyme